jgi:hypothetical protein
MLESDVNNAIAKMFKKLMKTCLPLGPEKREGVWAAKLIIINQLSRTKEYIGETVCFAKAWVALRILTE